MKRERGPAGPLGRQSALMLLLSGVLATAATGLRAADVSPAENEQRPALAVPADGPKVEAPGDDVRPLLGRLLREHAITGGAALHIGGRTTAVAEFLASQGRFLTQVVTDSQTTLEAVRQGLRDKGLYGPASAYRLREATLPYTENVARVVIVEDALKLDPNELRRVLAPGGVLMERSKDGWTTTVKPMPEAMDEWLHIDHDGGQSKASNDRLAGRPVNLRWQASSGMWGTQTPEQTTALMLAASGRLVTVRPSQDRGTMWMAAHCAWSGVLLWAKQLGGPAQGRTEVYKGVCPGLVADGKVWARGQALDLASGEARLEFEGLPRLAWQNVVVSLKGPDDEPRVFALSGVEDSKRPTKVKVIATDTGTGRQLWSCAGTDAVGLRSSVFVLAGTRDGRILEARETQTGRVIWQHNLAQETDQVGKETVTAAVALKLDLACTDRHVLVTLLKVTRTVLVYATADGTFERAIRFRNAGGTFCSWREFCPTRNGVAWCWAKANDGVEFYTPGKGWVSEPWPQATTAADTCRLAGIDLQTGQVAAAYPIRSGIRLRCSPWALAGGYAFFGDNGSMDLKDGADEPSAFFRLGCSIPYIPAYGTLYVPPSANCGCINRLHGLMAFETRVDGGRELVGVTDREYLEKGPAYAQVAQRPNLAGEALTLDKTLAIPALAATLERTSSNLVNAARTTVPWGANTQTRERAFTYMEDARGSRPEWLMAPIPAVLPWVAADGRIFAVLPNEHRVLMLPGKDKEVSWTFTADARFDAGQSPHLAGDLCVFGCRDGWVYAVRSADGALVWRNLAGPAERRVVAFEQFESPWPVVRNIVVHEGRVYAATGRHGSVREVGWMVSCFEVSTGKTLWKRRVPGATAPDDKTANALLRYRTDEVVLDVATHSVRSGFWHFDLETGAVSTVFDKAQVKTPEEWRKKFGEVEGGLRHRSY